MTMRRLHLDYRRRTPRVLPDGTVWVIAAASLLIGLIGYSGWLRSEIARAEQMHARVASAQPVRDMRKVALQRQEAQAAANRLALSWDALFAAIESATAGRQVALLSIRPDASKGTVRLSAEARTLDLALDYTEALAKAGALTDVHLVQHETVSGAQRAVRFSLVATWKQTT